MVLKQSRAISPKTLDEARTLIQNLRESHEKFWKTCFHSHASELECEGQIEGATFLHEAFQEILTPDMSDFHYWQFESSSALSHLRNDLEKLNESIEYARKGIENNSNNSLPSRLACALACKASYCTSYREKKKCLEEAMKIMGSALSTFHDVSYVIEMYSQFNLKYTGHSKKMVTILEDQLQKNTARYGATHSATKSSRESFICYSLRTGRFWTAIHEGKILVESERNKHYKGYVYLIHAYWGRKNLRSAKIASKKAYARASRAKDMEYKQLFKTLKNRIENREVYPKDEIDAFLLTTPRFWSPWTLWEKASLTRIWGKDDEEINEET